MTEKKELNFEKSFERLEAILNRMNSGSVALDESLKLYEEADALIGACASHLNKVESRIETLMKKRNGELIEDEKKEPLVETFHSEDLA